MEAIVRFHEIVESANSVDELFRDEFAVEVLHAIAPLQRRIKQILTEREYVKSVVRRKLWTFLLLAEKLAETPDCVKEIIKYRNMLQHRIQRMDIVYKHRKRLLYYLEMVELIFDDLPDRGNVQFKFNDNLSESLNDDMPKEFRSKPACSCCQSQTVLICDCGAASFCGPYCYIFSSHKCTKAKTD